MTTRHKLSSIVENQLPEFIRSDYQTFVAFVKAYYEYLELEQQKDPAALRSIDSTLDSFITYFRKEYAANAPQILTNERFFLSKVKDLYLSKGTEASFDLLLRLMFNKEISVKYPSEQILRASDGKWNLDVSFFAKLKWGTPEDIVGKTVSIITDSGPMTVFVDRYLPVNIIEGTDIVQSTDTFEFFVNKKTIDYVQVGDRVSLEGVLEGNVVSTSTKVKTVSAGKNFNPGELYSFTTTTGTGSTVKISQIELDGSIKKIELVKFGANYNADFTFTIVPETDIKNLQLGNIDAIPEDHVAVISVTTGPLAKYPGYYTTNDGFLDDAIYIQDGYYYQAFSYEISIDEQLDDYKSVLKTLIHPAGMALFGNYEIYNLIEIGAILEVAGQVIDLLLQEQVSILTEISSKDVVKSLSDSVSSSETLSKNFNKYISQPESVQLQDEGGAIWFDAYCEPSYFANDDGNYMTGTIIVF